MRLLGTQTKAEGRQLLLARGGHKVRPKEAFLGKASPPPFPSILRKGLEVVAVLPAESRVQEDRGDLASPASHPEGRRRGVAVPPG